MVWEVGFQTSENEGARDLSKGADLRKIPAPQIPKTRGGPRL